MTALPENGISHPSGLADTVIARLPESVFGNTEWVAMTARTGADHLRAAIYANRPYRVANAIRSMAFTPPLDDVETLAQVICDAIVSDGYASHHPETIAQVSNARRVIAEAVAELRSCAENASPSVVHLRETVSGYVRLVTLHDPQISARLDAVGVLTERLARSMRLPNDVVLEAEFAGRLHDIGMISVRRSTRTTTVPIRKRSLDNLKRHPITGASFLEGIPSLAHLAAIVRSHHERYDGHGYPDGLRGDEIPLVSRIVSVAAAFVNLVTGTSHFKPMLPNDACRELAVRAGTEFDPDVVTATLHLLHFRQRIRSA